MHITLHLCNEKSPNVIQFAEKMSEHCLDGCLKLADCLSASLLPPYRSSQTPQVGNIVAWEWNLRPVSQSHYSGVNLQRMYLHVDRASKRHVVEIDRCGRYGL
ncbi:peroxisome proliferator-activated receptor gamma coactivator 1-beta isoform X1 [Tachysurus ichikawai]